MLQAKFTHPNEGTLIVAVEGEFCASLAIHAVREQLFDENQGLAADVVLDFAGVTRIDSCGLGLLTVVHGWLAQGGRRLAVARPCLTVRALLTSTCVDQIVPVFDKVEDALASFSPAN